MGWVFGGLVVLLLVALFVVPFLVWGGVITTAFYPRAFFFPFGFLVFFFVIFFVVRALFWGWGWRGGWGRGYWGYRGGYGYWTDATEILRQRYAKGEISKDQFDQMMRDLKAQDA